MREFKRRGRHRVENGASWIQKSFSKAADVEHYGTIPESTRKCFLLLKELKFKNTWEIWIKFNWIWGITEPSAFFTPGCWVLLRKRKRKKTRLMTIKFQVKGLSFLFLFDSVSPFSNSACLPLSRWHFSTFKEKGEAIRFINFQPPNQLLPWTTGSLTLEPFFCLFSLYFLPFHGLTLQQPLDLNSWVSLDCLEASPHPSLTAWGPQLCASQCCALCFSGNEFITLASLCWSAFVSVPILRWKVLWELGPCEFCLLLYSQHSAWYPAQNGARKKILVKWGYEEIKGAVRIYTLSWADLVTTNSKLFPWWLNWLWQEEINRLWRQFPQVAP